MLLSFCLTHSVGTDGPNLFSQIKVESLLKAKENIDAAQDKQKRQYDSKHNALKVS